MIIESGSIVNMVIDSRGILIHDETGRRLDDVVRLDTDTGEYWVYVRDTDGAPKVVNGEVVLEKRVCIQFWFTFTLEPAVAWKEFQS
jgi:hypothetical protein